MVLGEFEGSDLYESQNSKHRLNSIEDLKALLVKSIIPKVQGYFKDHIKEKTTSNGVFTLIDLDNIDLKQLSKMLMGNANPSKISEIDDLIFMGVDQFVEQVFSMRNTED